MSTPTSEPSCEDPISPTSKTLKSTSSQSEPLNINNCDTKEELLNYINEKKRKIDQSKRMLELKYNNYKCCNDFWNIATIFLSTGLTLIESCKLIFLNEEDGDTLTNNFFHLTPILLGSIITCSSSILKFKKYQESMEELYIVIDKCIMIISKLKNKREEIRLLGNDKAKFEELKSSYIKELCNEYSIAYQETERYLNNKDYDIYLKVLNNSDFSRHILHQDKLKFFDNYKHKKECEELKTEANESRRRNNKRGCA